MDYYGLPLAAFLWPLPAVSLATLSITHGTINLIGWLSYYLPYLRQPIGSLDELQVEVKGRADGWMNK